jgi:hypothetical protein
MTRLDEDSTQRIYGLAYAMELGNYIMRQRMIVLSLAGLALGGCSMSPAPQGVLPRTDVPPPPSATGSVPNRAAVGATTNAQQPQRQGLSVPDRLVPRRPAARP